MTLSRRDWLRGTTVSAVSAVLPGLGGCADADPDPYVCADDSVPLPQGLPEDPYVGPPGPASVFSHGVASGDPLADRVILWTRVSPTASGSVDVFYEVAIDPGFQQRVAAGSLSTDPSRDYTVKVDATGLRPGRTYYYRFRHLGVSSPVGRTRTLPVDDVRRLRIAIASCSNYAFGYFHAYRHLAARSDLDLVVHLGDYIYEYGANGLFPIPAAQLRPWDPTNELVTLDDYRTRYRQYRTDPDLQEAHRQHPWVTLPDDHEIANDAYLDGAQNHEPSTEGAYADRKAAALQAMREYMPVRPDAGEPLYRTFRFGDLCDLLVVDTRTEGRVQQIGDVALDDPSRTVISATQEAWVSDRLDEAGPARWKLIAQAVMLARFTADYVSHRPYFMDQWDGYPSARARFLELLGAHDDVVVLTGDIHGSFACELPVDPWDGSYDPATGAGSMGVEFVCPGITSPGIFGVNFHDVVADNDPHIKFADFDQRGYAVLDVTRDKVQADWYFIDGVTADQGIETFGGAMAVLRGEPRIVAMSGPMPSRTGCDPAP